MLNIEFLKMLKKKLYSGLYFHHYSYIFLKCTKVFILNAKFMIEVGHYVFESVCSTVCPVYGLSFDLV